MAVHGNRQKFVTQDQWRCLFLTSHWWTAPFTSANDHRLYAFDGENGQKKWEFKATGDIEQFQS